MSDPSTIQAGTLFRVDGIVAAITGGGTGIGLMMARALIHNGAKEVFILGRRLDVLQASSRANPGLTPVQCDITSKASLQSAVDTISSSTGYLNLVVANSGIGGTSARYSSNPTVTSITELRRQLFTDHSMDEFTNTFAVNVSGAFFTMMAFLELLDQGNQNSLSEGHGSLSEPGGAVPAVQSQIVVTSSISAYIRGSMTPPSYGASKAAVLHLAKQASSQLAGYGVRVNALAPGLFPSDLAAPMIRNRKPDEEVYDDPRFIPARRYGGEEEMAGMILYLASPAGSFCNGLVLVADGGRLGVMTSSY